MQAYNFNYRILDDESNWKVTTNDNFHLVKHSKVCNLCTKPRTTFYCKHCVRNGDFIHSTSHFSERFAEKRLGVRRMQNKKNELIAECDKHVEILKLREDKFEDKRSLTEKITNLKKLVDEKRKKIERKKKLLKDLQNFNRVGHDDLRRNEACQLDLRNANIEFANQRPVLIAQVNDVKPRLKKLIRKRAEELVQLIFPINEIQSTRNSSLTSDSQEDIKNKLAEATRTAYIRGRWVFTDSWGETQHSIVAPTLPDSGDYSPYIHWVSANKDNTLGMTSSSDMDHNPAYNISAALTYTTQLVDILAHFLDLRLPNKLLYCEFCSKHMNERKFIKVVTCLNANVVTLCLSQNVDPSLLHPSQTIRNLLLLLDTSHSDLGRFDPTDIDATCISYLEEQLAHQIKSTAARLSVSDQEDDDRESSWTENPDNGEDDECDSDHLITEWEAVPLVHCPEAMPGSNSVTRKHTISNTQTSSIAGGLVTSAAASIASFWRGWSTNK